MNNEAIEKLMEATVTAIGFFRNGQIILERALLCRAQRATGKSAATLPMKTIAETTLIAGWKSRAWIPRTAYPSSIRDIPTIKVDKPNVIWLRLSPTRLY